VENFDGDLELKRLDLTWSGQVDSVDLTAATRRSRTHYKITRICVSVCLFVCFSVSVLQLQFSISFAETLHHSLEPKK